MPEQQGLLHGLQELHACTAQHVAAGTLQKQAPLHCCLVATTWQAPGSWWLSRRQCTACAQHVSLCTDRVSMDIVGCAMRWPCKLCTAEPCSHAGANVKEIQPAAGRRSKLLRLQHAALRWPVTRHVRAAFSVKVSIDCSRLAYGLCTLLACNLTAGRSPECSGVWCFCWTDLVPAARMGTLWLPLDTDVPMISSSVGTADFWSACVTDVGPILLMKSLS